VVICLERGADLPIAQLLPMPLTVSCSSKIQIGFTFLVTAHPGRPRQRAIKRVCVFTKIILRSSGNRDIGFACTHAYKTHIIQISHWSLNTKVQIVGWCFHQDRKQSINVHRQFHHY